MISNKYHTPVLLTEAVDGLKIKKDGVYVDVTYGGGGHSREILSRLGEKGRLIAFAGIDPQRENAVDIFDWAINKLGMKGLKLYPPTGFYPFDKRVYPLYERCESMGLPILIHTGGPGIALLPSRFANPIYLQDVQADFPKLNIWIGHAGHKLYREEAIQVAAVAVNTYLELSFWQEVAYEDEELFI